MKLTALAVLMLALGIGLGLALRGMALERPASAEPKCPGPSANCATPTPSPTPSPPPTATLVHTIANPNPEGADRFGQSVASIGSKLIVGAPGFSNAGIVYVFDSTTGSLLLTIPNPEPSGAGTTEFGLSLSAIGNNILVGAPNFPQDAVGGVGRVYLFDGTTGDLLLTIPNPAPASGDLFGEALAAVGGNILVGSHRDHPDGTTSVGSVYLFDGTSGDLLLAIPNPDPASNDHFGFSVSAVGGNVLVGAPGPRDEDPGFVAGSVYLFDGTNGDLLLKIPNPQPAPTDRFGSSVAANGTNILVGAPQDNAGKVRDAGSVYVFDGTTGDLLLTVANPHLGIGDAFGDSVAYVGGNILVGTPLEPLFGGAKVGSVYLFDATTGTLLLTIPNPTPDNEDEFGISVAGVEGSILVGALRERPGDTSAVGGAYLFETGGTP